MADTELAESGREDLAAVGRAVVGEHALDDDAVGGVEGPRAVEKADRRGGGGGAAVVVDGHMHAVPTDARVAMWGTASEHPVAATGTDAAEPLGIEMDEFARPLALVAHARRPWLPGLEPGA